jgi:hypothetical protein
MLAPPQRPNQRVANTLGIVVLALAAYAVVSILIWVGGIIEHVAVTQPVARVLSIVFRGVGGWTDRYATPVGTVALALVTALLWRATIVLGRASNAQLASLSPFLSVNFEIDDQLRLGADPAYLAEYTAQDQATARLQPHVQGQARYVRATVKNEQTSPHGVAAVVRVDVVLCWGGNDGDPTRPYELRRTIYFPAIPANLTERGPAFNVGTLPAFKVIVVDVSYLDIGRRKRRGAYTCGFDLWSTGFLKRLPLVIEPAKSEIGFWRIGKKG